MLRAAETHLCHGGFQALQALRVRKLVAARLLLLHALRPACALAPHRLLPIALRPGALAPLRPSGSSSSRSGQGAW